MLLRKLGTNIVPSINCSAVKYIPSLLTAGVTLCLPFLTCISNNQQWYFVLGLHIPFVLQSNIHIQTTLLHNINCISSGYSFRLRMAFDIEQFCWWLKWKAETNNLKTGKCCRMPKALKHFPIQVLSVVIKICFLSLNLQIYMYINTQMQHNFKRNFSKNFQVFF